MTPDRAALLAWVKGEALDARAAAAEDGVRLSKGVCQTNADHYDAIAALLEADGKLREVIEVHRLDDYVNEGESLIAIFEAASEAQS